MSLGGHVGADEQVVLLKLSTLAETVGDMALILHERSIPGCLGQVNTYIFQTSVLFSHSVAMLYLAVAF